MVSRLAPASSKCVCRGLSGAAGASLQKEDGWEEHIQGKICKQVLGHVFTALHLGRESFGSTPQKLATNRQNKACALYLYKEPTVCMHSGGARRCALLLRWAAGREHRLHGQCWAYGQRPYAYAIVQATPWLNTSWYTAAVSSGVEAFATLAKKSPLRTLALRVLKIAWEAAASAAL